MSAPGDLSPAQSFRHRTRLNSDRVYSDWQPSIARSFSAKTPSTVRNRLITFWLSRKHRIKIYVFIFALSFLAFFPLSLAYHSIANISRARSQQALLKPKQLLKTASVSNITDRRKSQHASTLSRSLSNASFHEIEASSPPLSADEPLPTRTGTVPVVYRAVLERLDHLNRQQEALATLPISIPFLDAETDYYYSDKLSLSALCSDSPCRFLLPLRIAEQESKARIHFLEIIQTAKRLDRILVLPHVGKSRLGLCFRWSFEAYYDGDLLRGTLHEEGVRAVTLEVFKYWLETKSPQSPRGQLVSLSSKAEPDRPGTMKFTDDIDRLIASVDTEPIKLQDPRLPGCFGDRFSMLLSSDFTPMAIYPSHTLSRSLRKQAIGEEFISFLDRKDIRNASRFPSLENILVNDQPEVLMLDWGMRHPIYYQPFVGSIAYSPSLELLAKKLTSPSSPYLMIHWRMESVSPDVLPNCAHDLVDTISNLLHTPNLGEGIQKVWFAGDYPVPIVNHLYPSSDQAQIPTRIQNKSGTFRDFGEKHTEAVDILVGAFREGAELKRWYITDLAAELVRMKEDNGLDDIHPEFLTDSGALGILDKIVSMNAAIFVGGSKRCGRTRSLFHETSD
ncbi:hypothetical protein J3R30DRAFT_228995 [Lentinula aciculospora]|uniref:Proteophosphoglycan 5 n=1 Tax=Lentinula aciculospora TaxID=153920 RepID=A0A9W9A9E1_9AGAR|nr:hypothetical protein J3R30DRAFT_228995 [Lentinula aciculospora]